MRAPVDFRIRALQEFQGNRRAEETVGYKKMLLLKLFEMPEYWDIPLDAEQRCNIAFSCVYGALEKGKANNNAAIWDDYLGRFRDCIQRAIKGDEIVDNNGQTDEITIGDLTFKIPQNVSEWEGLDDQELLMKVTVLLNDILSVLELVAVIRLKKLQKAQLQRASDQRKILDEIEVLTKECHENLDNRIKLKEKNFVDFCSSWGFSFPVTARSLMRKIPYLLNVDDLAQITQKFRKAHTGLLGILRREQNP